MATQTNNPGSSKPNGMLTSIGTSFNSTFNLESLSWWQVVALVGLVMASTMAWRQVINLILEEV